MFKTLYGKLAAVLLALVLLIGGLYILLTLFTTRVYLQEVNQRLHRTLAKNLVAEKVLLHGGEVNEEALKEVFHMLMIVNPGIEVYLLDTQGSILAFSALPGRVKRQQVSLEPIRHFLLEESELPVLGDDPRGLDRKKVFSASPVPLEGPPEGYLYVILGGEEYDSATQMLQGSYVLRLSTVAGVGGLAVALSAGLFLFRFLTQRLRRLVWAMESFRQKNFMQSSGPPAPSALDLPRESVQDEIALVEHTYYKMANLIAEQMERLRQTDELRRTLVANVSHDLRTPLASLNGYLETLLLKQDKLSPDQQRKYLEIAVRHGERLSKLVAELFELARLDSQEAPPNTESFSLGELVQDVAQKFHLAAEKKKVRLQTRFQSDLPFVSGDIGLMERAFENLIENALRHTPEGGFVSIELSRGGRYVAVRVADTGCGMAPEELSLIFQRFYQKRGNGQDKSDGAGLGLAITKRILDLHGSPLEASSTPGCGTTFTFRLPVSQT